MQIAPINNYNNRTSFKNLKLCPSLGIRPYLIDKVQKSNPISQVVNYWQEKGTDLTVSLSVDYFEKKLLDLVAISNGKIHRCSIKEDNISEFDAEKVIKYMKTHSSPNICRMNRGMRLM